MNEDCSCFMDKYCCPYCKETNVVCTPIEPSGSSIPKNDYILTHQCQQCKHTFRIMDINNVYPLAQKAELTKRPWNKGPWRAIHSNCSRVKAADGITIGSFARPEDADVSACAPEMYDLLYEIYVDSAVKLSTRYCLKIKLLMDKANCGGE